MTDPRIEAAVTEWKRQIDKISLEKTGKAAKWTDPEILTNIRNAMGKAIAAADAAAYVHIVPIPIPAERMRSAQSTLLCWKSGSLAHEDAISMIVCAVADSATPPQDEVKA